MTQCVVEVGPGTVRGQGDVAERLVATALECIDDEIALLDEQPVAVAAVWREVFRSALPDRVDTAVLVCPTWWPGPRVECVREAAAAISTNVVVLQRAQVLAGDAPGITPVIEIAPEFVAVCRAGCVIAAVPRLGEPARRRQNFGGCRRRGNRSAGGRAGRRRRCGRARGCHLRASAGRRRRGDDGSPGPGLGRRAQSAGAAGAWARSRPGGDGRGLRCWPPSSYRWHCSVSALPLDPT